MFLVIVSSVPVALDRVRRAEERQELVGLLGGHGPDFVKDMAGERLQQGNPPRDERSLYAFCFVDNIKLGLRDPCGFSYFRVDGVNLVL